MILLGGHELYVFTRHNYDDKVLIPCKPGVCDASYRTVLYATQHICSVQVPLPPCFGWSSDGLYIVLPILPVVNKISLMFAVFHKQFSGAVRESMDHLQGLACSDSNIDSPEYAQLANFWRNVFGESSISGIASLCASKARGSFATRAAACLFRIQNPGPVIVDVSDDSILCTPSKRLTTYLIGSITSEISSGLLKPHLYEDGVLSFLKESLYTSLLQYHVTQIVLSGISKKIGNEQKPMAKIAEFLLPQFRLIG